MDVGWSSILPSGARGSAGRPGQVTTGALEGDQPAHSPSSRPTATRCSAVLVRTGRRPAPRRRPHRERVRPSRRRDLAAGGPDASPPSPATTVGMLGPPGPATPGRSVTEERRMTSPGGARHPDTAPTRSGCRQSEVLQPLGHRSARRRRRGRPRRASGPGPRVGASGRAAQRSSGSGALSAHTWRRLPRARTVSGPTMPSAGRPAVRLELAHRSLGVRPEDPVERSRRRSPRAFSAPCSERTSAPWKCGKWRYSSRSPSVNVASTSADHVAGPTSPSSSRPRSSWNARTAASGAPEEDAVDARRARDRRRARADAAARPRPRGHDRPFGWVSSSSLSSACSPPMPTRGHAPRHR